MNNDNFLKIFNTLCEFKENVDKDLYFRVTENGVITVGTTFIKEGRWGKYSCRQIIAKTSFYKLSDDEAKRFITIVENKLKTKLDN